MHTVYDSRQDVVGCIYRMRLLSVLQVVHRSSIECACHRSRRVMFVSVKNPLLIDLVDHTTSDEHGW